LSAERPSLQPRVIGLRIEQFNSVDPVAATAKDSGLIKVTAASRTFDPSSSGCNWLIVSLSRDRKRASQ
jgi:hypothetical protein